MSETFKALMADQRDGKLYCEIRELGPEALPKGNVTIAVEYSSLNYKDGLAVTGKGPILRKFPMVPGIDLAGTVEHSDTNDYKPGDRVAVTGWGIGERFWGGFTQKNRVKAEWLVRLPPTLTTKDAMAIGTAGLTAMLCVMALQQHGVKPESGDIAVTGAAGGVGSVAVAVLAQLGYRVVASTGRPEAHEYLRNLGAGEIIDRSALSESTPKPLEMERWAGAVDSVGGTTLANLLKTTKYRGSVTACGLAGGADLTTSVFPFILRGVNLLGIDSMSCPTDIREEAWKRLASDLPLSKLSQMMAVVPLADVERLSLEILAGKVQGRTVVDVRA